MRFKQRDEQSGIPELNLVPMLDVLMTVLTFFIIVSMTLNGQQLLKVRLPGAGTGVDESGQPVTTIKTKALIIGLNENNELLLDNHVSDLGELSQRMRKFLAENPEGIVILKADRELPYEQVAKTLLDLRNIGGERVSLAVQ